MRAFHRKRIVRWLFDSRNNGLFLGGGRNDSHLSVPGGILMRYGQDPVIAGAERFPALRTEGKIRNHCLRLSPPDPPGSRVMQEPSGHFQPIHDHRHVPARKYGQECADHARGISLHRERGNGGSCGAPIQTGAAGEQSSLSISLRESHHGS